MNRRSTSSATKTLENTYFVFFEQSRHKQGYAEQHSAIEVPVAKAWESFAGHMRGGRGTEEFFRICVWILTTAGGLYLSGEQTHANANVIRKQSAAPNNSAPASFHAST